MLFGKDNIKPSTTENYSYKETKKIKEKGYEKYGTASDWTGIFIGTLVAGFTIALFYQTKEATKTSKDAVAEAKRANDISEHNFQLSKRQFESGVTSGKAADIRADSSLKIQKQYADAQIKSVNAQTKALAQTQKDFELENRPFISVVGLKIDTVDFDNRVGISFNLYNVGKFPAKIFFRTVRVDAGIDTTRLIFKNKDSVINNSEFVAYQGGVGCSVGITSIIPEEYKKIKKGISSVFVFTKVFYIDYGRFNSYYLNRVYQITFLETGLTIQTIRNEGN